MMKKSEDTYHPIHAETKVFYFLNYFFYSNSQTEIWI